MRSRAIRPDIEGDAHLLEQIEFRLKGSEATATADDLAAEEAAATAHGTTLRMKKLKFTEQQIVFAIQTMER
jgi:hypothetical protein